MMDRVVSKNLFNFAPAGQVDEEVVKLEDLFEDLAKSSPEAEQVSKRMKELEQLSDEASTAEYMMLLRSSMSQYVSSMNDNEGYKWGAEQTDTTTLKVPTTHDGEFDVTVEVYTPKSLAKETKRAAYVYAHGGGAVALTAAECGPARQCDGVTMNMVVFNVDYRLAPETKCPNNIKDFYECIKYVSANAESLGIDPSKIVIGGESGGGYICLGAMVLLAEAGEGQLIKLAIPTIPMTDDYCFSDPLVMTIEERKSYTVMRKMWGELIASDFEAQKSSPYLFPGKASEELLAKFPPTIVFEHEFDMFITEATRLAGRLRRAGRLLEFVVIPGSTHISPYIPGFKGYEIRREVLKKIADEYIHS